MNPLVIAREVHHGLEVASKLIQKRAQDSIGHYQDAVGPFPAWAPLAESTQAERSALGYTADDPLLRSGELRRSIEREVHPDHAVIGSKDEKAAWMEFGTSRIPPRPFIGPAAFRSKKEIHEILGTAAVRGICGGQRIGRLGYDF